MPLRTVTVHFPRASTLALEGAGDVAALALELGGLALVGVAGPLLALVLEVDRGLVRHVLLVLAGDQEELGEAAHHLRVAAAQEVELEVADLLAVAVERLAGEVRGPLLALLELLQVDGALPAVELAGGEAGGLLLALESCSVSMRKAV